MVEIWRVKIGPQWETDDVIAVSIEDAIAKVKKKHKKILADDDNLYISSAELLASSDY